MEKHHQPLQQRDRSAREGSVESLAEQADPTEGTSSSLRWVNREWVAALVSFILLASGLVLDWLIVPLWFQGATRFLWYIAAYLPVALPVISKGIQLAFQGELFTEFSLMSIATIGAFYVGEPPEAVAVMLFYAVGELFQGAAVNRAKRSIRALLDVRPNQAFVKRNEKFIAVHPSLVEVGEVIQVNAGSRVPLDGELLSDGASFNTSALTGESLPHYYSRSEMVLAGMINESDVIQIKAMKKFNDSSIARILDLVQNAQGRKARTELFIRRFARIYTPIVVMLAMALVLIPYFIVEDYHFNDWLYRAMIFLVISCPCALVVAIPLGYFGGIGAASRHGVLFKGSSYLDRMARIDTVVMDKTGTLTKGIFKVEKIIALNEKEDKWMPAVVALEERSSHPIAKAVAQYGKAYAGAHVTDVEEIKGQGMKGMVDGAEILLGNKKFLEAHNVHLQELSDMQTTTIFVARDRRLSGYLVVADELKEDARQLIEKLHASKIRTIILSGDKQSVVDAVAKALNVSEAYGDLSPEEKMEKVEAIKKGKEEAVAFVGDGINDAPVLAVSDVGIAMGGMGSDAAIETADVVIQTDQPSKIPTAIHIGKATNRIVWQNISLAFIVKALVLALGAWGAASMWGAVFADVGVALLAILNAVRIQQMRFS